MTRGREALQQTSTRVCAAAAVAAVALALACLASEALADVWTEPSPIRREALMEGRGFTYNTEAFLQRFSYRHLSDLPPTHADGIRGTGGSVTADELFLDIHAQKTLLFDDGHHGVFLRVQRFEDFDGRFDRQIIGVQRRLNRHWNVALAGDVQGSKGETDVQLEARWQPDERRVARFVYVRPELFFNDKGDEDLEYRRDPQTLFLHYRHVEDGGWSGEVAVNHSPRTVLASEIAGLQVGGEQTRLMARGRWPARLFSTRDDARIGFRLEVEATDRSFDWGAPPAPDADDFRRRMTSADMHLELTERRWTPSIGYRWFRLHEDGWFGDELATAGRVRRDEHLAYAGMRIPAGGRQAWEPAVYVARVNAERTFDQRPGDDRDESRWAGKLSLPWRYLVNEQAGAVLSVGLTFRLHEARFGGGNVQLHWPLD